MAYYEIFDELGAYDVVSLLYELHTRGFQNLRLVCMMAPNGCAMRTSIVAKANLADDFRPVRWEDDMMWPHSSSFNRHYKGSISEMADKFIKLYPRLCENGRGSDPGYSAWLRNLMPLMFEGWYPEMDYISHEEIQGGFFLKGAERIPFPPK